MWPTLEQQGRGRACWASVRVDPSTVPRGQCGAIPRRDGIETWRAPTGCNRWAVLRPPIGECRCNRWAVLRPPIDTPGTIDWPGCCHRWSAVASRSRVGSGPALGCTCAAATHPGPPFTDCGFSFRVVLPVRGRSRVGSRSRVDGGGPWRRLPDRYPPWSRSAPGG